MKKKVVSILLAAAMITTMVVGCGQQGTTKDSTDTATVGEEKTEASEDTKQDSAGGSDKIVYAHRTLDQEAHVAMQQGVDDRSVKDGYKFEGLVCNVDLATQNDQLKTVALTGAKALLVNPVDSDGVVDAAKAVMDAGIPVACVDTPLNCSGLAVSVVFNNTKCGEMAGERVVELLKEKYGEEKGTVVNVYGSLKSQAWRERKEGFESIIKKYPNIKYVETPGEGEMAASQDALTNTLAELNYEVDAVHAPSDAPCLGLAEALKTANMWKKVGEDGHIIFVSVDGEPGGLKNVKDGYYDATVVLDCYGIGQVTVDLLETYSFEGKEVPTSGTYDAPDFAWKSAEFSESEYGPVLNIPPYYVTTENVDDPANWGNVVSK
ncbi:MAG: sugar ABC transporter substrate-binding protein [Lachnospiraceae bacterium]|nr:sugar ABC transporter substrate-binding protein [Lachnospiraceae bacterium]